MTHTNYNTLADEYARLKLIALETEKRLSTLKATLRSYGTEYIEGEKCIIQVCLSERSTLDVEKVKLVAPHVALQCSKTTLVETLRIKPKL